MYVIARKSENSPTGMVYITGSAMVQVSTDDGSVALPKQTFFQDEANAWMLKRDANDELVDIVLDDPRHPDRVRENPWRVYKI